MMIYLASQSPRRAELLQQIGVDFRLLLPQSAAEKQDVADLQESCKYYGIRRDVAAKKQLAI